ncbi:MAG TPA: M36 family metallopeptidase [Jatrophihabitantaceae bacterium]
MARPAFRSRCLVAAVAGSAALLGVVVPTITASASPPAPKPSGAAAKGAAQPFDVRQGGSAAQVKALSDRRAKLQASSGVRALSQQLGPQGIVDMDPVTGTPSQVARLDGMLTGPSQASASDIALGYVRAHPDVFHLSGTDTANFLLARDYVDIAGIHHLSFTQEAGGLTLFGNGLKANVTKDGQLINITGSPLPSLTAPAATASSITGSAAITVAKRDTGERNTAPAKGDTSEAVLFRTPGGTRRAWETVTMSAAQPTLDVVDAQSGRVLYRQPLSDDYVEPSDNGSSPSATSAAASAPAQPAKVATQYANVVDNYLGAPRGGDLHTVDLNQNGWLPKGSVVLFGNNAHTYADINDNDQADPNEEIIANGQQGYRFPLVTTNIPDEPCTAFVCTWDPSVPRSWQANESRTATQNFYFVNKWHDHLEAAPIGFTEAAGNFQQVNSSGQGAGGDAVLDQPLDGANIANGLPDANHIDNANFATPPDGQAPTMQMYLWHLPGTTFAQDPFIAASGADEADIVYHEYTHGLSHRLVVDATNTPALDSWQGASMGEAWSDWYANDDLVNEGYTKDTAQPGDILVGGYVHAGSTIRSQPLDCPVGTTSPKCPGTPQAGAGGYTYGDMGKISTRPGGDVHKDGEIWAETLWDVRDALGSKLSESLVTRAMELSPTFPSMLDMRNSIIEADMAINGGKHVAKLWKIFANRGMGFFAGSVSGDDRHPVESFSLPPAPGTPRATVTGTVTDSASGAGLADIAVGFGGHDSGFPGDYMATTDASGKYTITGIFPGTYPDVYAGPAAGYNTQVRAAVPINSGTTTLDWQLVRDWASSGGGATVTDFNGPDYTGFGCGPTGDIDQSQGSGWGSDSDLAADGTPSAATPKFTVIKLPSAVNISQFAIDPSNTCGDDTTAATGDYKVETSVDGTTWQQAAAGTFTPADLGKLVSITPTGTTGQGVQYLKFWMLSPQAVTQHVGCPAAGVSGCDFLDSSEVEAFGIAA